MISTGKAFESDFKKSIPTNIYYLRLKDPAQSFNQNADTGLRFSAKNPFDAVMFTQKTLFCMELKSTMGTAFSFGGKTPMIKEHQIEELTKASVYNDVIPGFVFNMTKHEKTYFLHITDFNNFKNDTDKKSINLSDIVTHNGIEIIGEIKKVHYKYYIEDFVNKILRVIV